MSRATLIQGVNMETLIFVLGTLSGLVLLALGYAVVGVFKINKQIKSLQQDMEGIHRDGFRDVYQTIDNQSREIDQRFEAFHRDVDIRFKELYHEYDQRSSHVHNRIDEVHGRIDKDIDQLNRYIDSRLDKLVDSLSKETKNKKTVETV
jgi:uncharacterized membrane protein YgaE (UPF0421/DUF939 family)